MSAGFDPYYKLLGIPPEEQPPTYYRLLGLTRNYEDDLEVIENCSNRVLQSLRQHQSGPHGPEVAKLLNEVSTARRTLLNAEKKAAYDAELKASEAVEEEGPEEELDLTPELGIGADDVLKRFKRSKNVLVPAIAAVALLALAAGGYLLFLKPAGPDEKLALDAQSNAATDAGEKPPVEPESQITEQGGSGKTPASQISSQGSTPNSEPAPGTIRVRTPAIDLPVAARAGKEVDLLPLIDPVKDGSAGDWVKDGPMLTSRGSGVSALVFPFETVPQSLKLNLVIERLENGPGEVLVQIPTEVKPAVFGLDVGSPAYCGAFIDTTHLTMSPRAHQGHILETKQPVSLSFLVTGIQTSIQLGTNGREPLMTWGGDYHRLTAPSEDLPKLPKRFVLVTRGTRFKIHSLSYSALPAINLPQPPTTVNGSDLISIVQQTRDALRGDWGYQTNPIVAPSTPFGRLQIPVATPDEYDLSVRVETAAADNEIVIGLPMQGVSRPFFLGTKQCRLSGMPPHELDTDTFPPDTPVQFDFQVRRGAMNLMKDGKVLLRQQTAVLPKSQPDGFAVDWLAPEDQNRIFFGTTTASYKIHGIGMAANSGTELASSIRSSEPTSVAAANTAEMPNREGFKAPEGSLTGSDDTGPTIEKVKEPSLTERETAFNTIKSQFKAELLKAKKPADKFALAEKLKSTAEGEPVASATHYVLLLQVCELAAAAGEPKVSLEAIDDLDRNFELDALKLKADTLKTLGRTTKDNEKLLLVLDSLFSLASQAADREKYSLAVDLYGIAAGIGTRIKLRPLTEEANELKRAMLDHQEEFAKVESARKSLNNDPDDATANLVVGQYTCITRGDWTAGLMALKRSSDAELQALAERDLAQPSDSKTQGKLGRDWLAYAQLGSQHSRAAFATRAVHWLALAAEQATGLDQRQFELNVREAVAVRDWDQPYTALLEKLGKSVEQNKTVKTPTIGSGRGSNPNFEELPGEPGILVGFDIRIRPSSSSANGESFRTEVVELVQPIFLTASGLKPATKADQDTARGTEIIQIRARRGYAISGLKMEVIGSIYRASFHFRKITSKGLDADRQYWSQVLGSGLPVSRSPRQLELDTRALPIVGVYGYRTRDYEQSAPGRRIYDLGFITASP